MSEFIVITRVNPQVQQALAGRANVNTLRAEAKRGIHLYTANTPDDMDTLEQLRVSGHILGLIVLPDVNTL